MNKPLHQSGRLGDAEAWPTTEAGPATWILWFLAVPRSIFDERLDHAPMH